MATWWQPTGEGFLGGIIVAIGAAFGFNRRMTRIENEQKELWNKMLPRKEFNEHQKLIEMMNNKIDSIERKLDKYIFNNRKG